MKGEGGDGKKSGNGAKKKSSAGPGEKPTEEQVGSEITVDFKITLVIRVILILSGSCAEVIPSFLRSLQVEKLEEKLEAAQGDQKNLFLIIFQRFIMILSEHLVRCDTDGVDFKNPW